VTVSEDDWIKLEADHRPGQLTWTRIHPESEHNLYLQIVDPGAHRTFALRMRERPSSEVVRLLRELRQTRGIAVQVAPAGEGRRDLQVQLLDAGLGEVFTPLVADITQTVVDTAGAGHAPVVAIERFEHWRRLLQSVADEGLSTEKRRGLFGELTILFDHVIPAVGQQEAVSGWTGPLGRHQDFQLSTSAIEVKTTTAKQPQAIEITSERELDDQGIAGRLLLTVLSVDERQGGAGSSLNALVDTIRATLGATARSRFEDMLVRVGYLPHQKVLYHEPRYTIRSLGCWRVAGDFPRITEKDLRPGVGDCHYRITVAGLDSYSLKPSKIADFLRGSAL
jgi:hypothetical protein